MTKILSYYISILSVLNLIS